MRFQSQSREFGTIRLEHVHFFFFGVIEKRKLISTRAVTPSFIAFFVFLVTSWSTIPMSGKLCAFALHNSIRHTTPKLVLWCQSGATYMCVGGESNRESISVSFFCNVVRASEAVRDDSVVAGIRQTVFSCCSSCCCSWRPEVQRELQTLSTHYAHYTHLVFCFFVEGGRITYITYITHINSGCAGGRITYITCITHVRVSILGDV